MSVCRPVCFRGLPARNFEVYGLLRSDAREAGVCSVIPYIYPFITVHCNHLD
jgi:hypothetical protein